MQGETSDELLTKLKQQIAYEILNEIFDREFRSAFVIDPITNEPVECIVKDDLEAAFNEINNKYKIEVTLDNEKV